MYEAHFGLNSRPFGAKAEGPQIFIGPQQVKAVQGVQKGLLAQDGVVAVSGPIGAGKTTIVAKALDTVKPNRMAAWIGRMNLAQDELLDLLLAGFGVRQQVNGSVRRFALFRRIMAERAAAGAAVAVVVEDAIRLGVDTLAELEALTAADTGDSIGANIILMGPPELNQFLKDPSLARLKQRVRRREKVAAFSQAEVTGYLKHCLRQAGGDYEMLFEPGVDQIVFRCSEGVPRVINTLCENVLTAAVESGQKRITTGLMHEVASDNYTYEGPPPDFSEAPDIDWEAPPVIDGVEKAPAGNDALVVDEDELPPAARNIVVESGHYPELPDINDEATEAGTGPATAAKDAPATASKPLPEVTPEAKAETPDPELTAPPAPKEEDRREPLAEALPTTQPGAVAVSPDVVDPQPEAAEAPEFEIPDLINDTHPRLSTLPPPSSDEAVKTKAQPVEETAPASDSESGSTIVLEKPEGIDMVAAEAIGASVDDDPEPVANDEPETTAESAADDDESDEDENFDLDSALSIETDETNVMKSITPNLDVLGNENQAQPAAADTAQAPAVDDLPTLSNSMRVDVDKEVKKARKVEAAAKQRAPQPTTTAAPAVPPKSAEKANAAGPAPTASPATAPKPESRPAQQPTPTATKPAGQETEVPAARPDHVAKAVEEATEKPVSEMTARIRSIDIEKHSRGNEVDSLAAALEAAKKGNLDDLTAAPLLPQVAGGDAAVDTPEPKLPEITLDKELEEKQKKKREELEKYAREISSANSLEEFSDAMAETLFGNEEFEAIAAEVVANPPDDHELAGPPPDGPSPVLLEVADVAADASPSVSLELEPEPVAAAAASVPGGSLRESQTMRADMLNSLNGNQGNAFSAMPVAEKVELGKESQPGVPLSSGSQPESIENQMETVMTQTLAALDVSKMAEHVEQDEADEKPKKKSGGLFSRFRRSS